MNDPNDFNHIQYPLCTKCGINHVKRNVHHKEPSYWTKDAHQMTCGCAWKPSSPDSYGLCDHCSRKAANEWALPSRGAKMFHLATAQSDLVLWNNEGEGL